jgi:UDPglucose--hexose-1-phosphate uridylyltransferase
MPAAMAPPELRRDPLSRRWVIMASERAQRPKDYAPHPLEGPPSFDPFAEGNEDKTPPEVAAYRQPGTLPNQPGWTTRVVPNKYPALQVEGNLHKEGLGIYDRMEGIGAHEIIIETPDCAPSFSHLPPGRIADILWMYRDRLLDLQKDRRIKHATIFKNVGRDAGATLYHTHSQLIATPVVPVVIEQKLKACEEYQQFRGRCLFEDLLRQEEEDGSRIVADGDHFVAFCPYASRFPFETWIVPRVSVSHFESSPRPLLDEMARILKNVLLRLETGLERPAYNFMLFTAPFGLAPTDAFRWHLEIIPRLTNVAGFEWGTGFYINPVPPEEAAPFLRGVSVPP